MKTGTKTTTLLGFLVTSYIVGLLIFTKGFLLVRTVIPKNSSCEVEFAARADDLVHGGHHGCWSHARFKRAILVIIDALRYDFLAYNTSLKSDVPLYKNKLKYVHQMCTKHPKHTRLYKFIADPPTTTLQRLKGLTTGSLPTFVDAGENFFSSEIREDNWIDQLNERGKTIKFLGDDTWDNLFPKRFYKSHSFPSFNVKDLHTVDNGILKHLYAEIRRKDWDVAIAHFLGVDHCGHRFGPNHPAMGEKLQQMDQVIRNISQLMKDDTVLFVLGDHGMTRTGDHGGDSEDELTAGLFVYSPAQITASSALPEDKPQVIQQTDLVPTIALMLGLPIPFSNVGKVIPDLFNHCPWWDTQHNDIRQVFHTVKALHLNARQVSKYLDTYATMSSDLPADKFQRLQTMLKQAEMELQDLVTSVTKGVGSPGLLERLLRLSDQYQDYLAQVRGMCQEVWAKFDLTSMALGVIMVMGSLIVNALLAVSWSGEGEDLPAYLPFMIGGIVIQVVYYVVHMAVFPPSVVPVMGYIVGGLLIFAGGVILKKQVAEIWRDSKINVADVAVAAGVMFMCFAAFFSNSFVVYEDSLTHFLSQSLLWYTSLRVMISSCQSPDHMGKDSVGRWSRKSKQSSFVDVLERLTQPAVVTFAVTVLCSLLLRCSAYFRACREEQWECVVPSFLEPLSSFAEDVTGYKNQRYFFSISCLFVTIWLVRRWLQHYGNLNGDGLGILCTKFLLPLAAIACALYWAVQALPHKELDLLPSWQQTIMAQIVYVCIIIHVMVGLVQPLYVYIHHSSSSGKVSVPLVNRGAEQTVPYVYRQLQQHWHRKDDSETPPAAYGLGSVYSSHLVAFAMTLFLLLVLLLGDGVSPALCLAVWVLFLFLEMMAAYCSETTGTSGIHQQPVPWLTVVTHGLLSSTFFYATGHQATIPSIRFESAFVGFYGNFTTYIIPALLITLNTYAGPVLFTVVSPLMMMWPHLQGPVCQWMVGRRGKKEGEEWKGDFSLFDDGVLLRKNLFVSVCRVLLFQAVKVLGAACAAALHRRHLMVWKIFAPRFIFEAASLIVISVALLMMTLIVLRVDRSLSKLTQSLQKGS
ncbi:GPI ethanolamine phosphate transferase 3, catalytic subunit-like [Babylonia areolata]|uniref:GPI ethanolamine phosphate transferase 3, catalytic subunit-like n=1 Tax=Babylonia areolata TaxID=304850 RepID=UPI003FD6460B